MRPINAATEPRAPAEPCSGDHGGPCTSSDVRESAAGIAGALKLLARPERWRDAGSEDTLRAMRRARCCLTAIVDAACVVDEGELQPRKVDLNSVLELVEAIGAVVVASLAGERLDGEDVGVCGVALGALARLTQKIRAPHPLRDGASLARVQAVLTRVVAYMGGRLGDLAAADVLLRGDSAGMCLVAAQWSDDRGQRAPDAVAHLALAMMRDSAFGADPVARVGAARAVYHSCHELVCPRNPAVMARDMVGLLVDDPRGGVGSELAAAEAATIALRDNRELGLAVAAKSDDAACGVTVGCLALSLAKTKSGSRAALETGDGPVHRVPAGCAGCVAGPSRGAAGQRLRLVRPRDRLQHPQCRKARGHSPID